MIQSNYLTAAIILMAIITFSVRYSFFTSIITIKLTPRIKTILSFTAPCVLTAMVVPIVFQDILLTKEPSSLLTSPYFLAGICSIVFSLFIRSTLTVIILSLLTFYSFSILTL